MHFGFVFIGRWVERASDASETIVSISSDGRVTQWSVKKGLEFADLMKLKRAEKKRRGVGRG